MSRTDRQPSSPLTLYQSTTLDSLVEEQGIVLVSVCNQPSHRSYDIRLGGDRFRVLRIIGEHDDIFHSVSKSFYPFVSTLFTASPGR